MWGVDHKNIVSHLVLHWMIWPLGLVVPPPPYTPLAERWYNTTYHGATKMSPYKVVLDNPPAIPSFLPKTSKAQEAWISILTQKITLFVLLRTFWSWFKMEWSNKHFNNSHSVALKKWTNFFYLFFLISGNDRVKASPIQTLSISNFSSNTLTYRGEC